MSVPTPVSGSRILRLRVVETVRERGDRDDEADADAEAERVRIVRPRRLRSSANMYVT